MFQKLKNLFPKNEINERIKILEKNVIELKEQLWYLDIEIKSKGYGDLCADVTSLKCWNRELENKIKKIDQKVGIYGTVTPRPNKVGRQRKTQGNKSPIRRSR